MKQFLELVSPKNQKGKASETQWDWKFRLAEVHAKGTHTKSSERAEQFSLQTKSAQKSLWWRDLTIKKLKYMGTVIEQNWTWSLIRRIQVFFFFPKAIPVTQTWNFTQVIRFFEFFYMHFTNLPVCTASKI